MNSKEYEANSDGGANIPLSLEVQADSGSDEGVLEFQYQADADSKREKQWSTRVSTDKRYRADIIINTATPGSVQLYWGGEAQELGEDKETELEATTFPGQADPKFGAYRGEENDIDTFVYLVKVEEM